MIPDMDKPRESIRTKHTPLTTILFDLDGTLLPLDQERFTRAYFKLLEKKFAGQGYDAERMVEAVCQGTVAMLENDGSRSNEEAFWQTFARRSEAPLSALRALFEDFYARDFSALQGLCGFTAQAAETVRMLRRRGYRPVLATNPLFPAQAIEARMRWAGLEPADFELYTTYENIGFSKPNSAYYREILRRLDVRPEEGLMVGNDTVDDMAAREIGLRVFLLSDCLIKRGPADCSACPQGSFPQLRAYIAALEGKGEGSRRP